MPRTRPEKHDPPEHLRLIGPGRHLFQCIGVLLFLAVPFLRPGGIGVLRIDLAGRRLELFGRLVLLDQMYLVLLAALAFMVLFLLVTLVLGRLWCGWACPQTTLSQSAEAIARRIGLKIAGTRIEGKPLRQVAFHVSCLALSFLVAANVLWYFLPPKEFFARLLQGDLGTTATLALASLAALIYCDLVLVRRLLCREFCPYGRFQSALMDGSTLTLAYSHHREEDCLNCGACTRACPTGIDIRQGLQVECIACGRCLDACRRVQSGLGRPGLIEYRFGVAGKGPAALLNPRTLLLFTLFVGLCITLAVGSVQREAPGFTLHRSAAPPRVLPDGRTAFFYTAQLANRTDRLEALELHAATAQGEPVELRGPTAKIELSGYERRRVDFALIGAPPGSKTESIIFTLSDTEGRRLGEIRSTLVPVQEIDHEQ